MQMQTALYTIWLLFPIFFFFVFLWRFLEQLSGKPVKGSPSDAVRQGFFVLACVLVCIVIDQYILSAVVDTIAPEFLPLELFQVVLLPAVFYLAALIIGPSNKILIGKAPHPSEHKRRRK